MVRSQFSQVPEAKAARQEKSETIRAIPVQQPKPSKRLPAVQRRGVAQRLLLGPISLRGAPDPLVTPPNNTRDM